MITLDTIGFRAWLKAAGEKMQSGARQALGQSVNLALQHARGTQAFKDGPNATLRKSIVRFDKGTWHLGIKATAKHAVFVEKGTKPHVIEARKARVLRFVQDGGLMFRRRVKHPGTKPTHFMEDAGKVGQAALVRMLEKMAGNAFR